MLAPARRWASRRGPSTMGPSTQPPRAGGGNRKKGWV